MMGNAVIERTPGLCGQAHNEPVLTSASLHQHQTHVVLYAFQDNGEWGRSFCVPIGWQDIRDVLAGRV